MATKKNNKKEKAIEEIKKPIIRKHPIVNFIVFALLIVSFLSFIYTILNKSDSLINLISSLLLTIFVIMFSMISITYKRNNKSMVLVGSILLIGYFIINMINPTINTNVKGIPNFTGKRVTDVMKWASKNKITINQEYEYSDMIPEYYVISQKSNNKELTVSISEGANPSKEIIIPNMIGWDDERVLKFIKDNYLSNVIVEFVESEKVKNTVINQNTSGSLKRDDEIILTFSYGEEELPSEITLIDFTKKTKFEVEFYMKQNKLKYSFNEDFSNKIKRGLAMKQSIKAGNKVNIEDDEIIVTISKGSEIKVPDFSKYSMTEITEWAINNKVKLSFVDQYDDSVRENSIISTSVNKDDIIEQGTVIKVVLSRGSLKMPKFNSLQDFYDWANKYEIKYEEVHEFSDSIKAGEVISYSYKTGEVIKNGDSIKVKISDGSKKSVPNVVGLTKNNAITKLVNAGFKYSVVYKNSTESKDKVLSQSISAGSEVSKDTTITITVSNGKAPTNNNNNNNNIQPRVDPPTPDPEPQCNQCTITGIRGIISANIEDGYNAVANALRSHIQSQCSGIIVNILADDTSNKRSGSFIDGFNGGNTTTCSTISITLAK